MLRYVRGVVSGTVQGVGYRYFFRLQATRIGVTGWIRNLPTGSVLFEVTGTPNQIDELLILADEGPKFAEVDEVTIEFNRQTETSPFKRFEIQG